MAQSTREIKRSIRSVKSTKQITRAMQLVSASKMRRAQQRALASRSFSSQAHVVLQEISKLDTESIRYSHPLLQQSPVERVLIVLVTSNRGLAGGYNALMLRAVEQALNTGVKIASYLDTDGKLVEPVGAQVDFVTLGKRGEQYVRAIGGNIIASFSDMTDIPHAQDAYPIARLVLEEYGKHVYQKVLIAYTHFVSAIQQQPKIVQVIPIVSDDVARAIGYSLAHPAQEELSDRKLSAAESEYLFEPSVAEVLDSVLESLVEAQILQAVLEARASEHAARMVAMKNATDSAKKMVDALNLSYNQARQAGITREIAEIAAGSAALTES